MVSQEKATLIRAELLVAGVSSDDLEKLFNVTRAAISLVIRGKSTNQRIQNYIEAKIGYRPDGWPTSTQKRKKSA